MSLLGEIVGRRIGEILHREEISSWDVHCRESDVCSVVTSRFELTLFIDNRNQQVTSTIEYSDIPERFKCALPVRVVSEMFPDLHLNDGFTVQDLGKRIEIELDNVEALFATIRENEITYRDLFFFYDGYNAGYTYVYSLDSIES
jgi:hypothetical protein